MKDLKPMEMKQINSKQPFGQHVMIVTTPDADMKDGIDYTIGNLNIAYRTRRPKMKDWGEISIRNSVISGRKTERAKIEAGECKSPLFVFEFSDGYVVCPLEEILRCLKNKIGYVKENHDGSTAYYIKFKDIHCFVINKDQILKGELK